MDPNKCFSLTLHPISEMTEDQSNSEELMLCSNGYDFIVGIYAKYCNECTYGDNYIINVTHFAILPKE